MESGSLESPNSSTFSLTDEDHTLGNAVRFVLNQDPRTSFCGYSIPHPSENRVNIRVQTTVGAIFWLLGDPAKDVFKDALQDLMSMCQHVRGTVDKAVIDFKKKGAKGSRQRNTKGGDREKVVRKAVGDMNID